MSFAGEFKAQKRANRTYENNRGEVKSRPLSKDEKMESGNPLKEFFKIFKKDS